MLSITLLLGQSALAHPSLVEHTHDEPTGAEAWEGGAWEDLEDLEEIAFEGEDPHRIINGEPAEADEYPQAGAMLLDADLDLGSYGSGTIRTFTCSSTLIAPDVVLLAAHCLDETAYTMGYGTMEINEIRWTRQADLTDFDGTRRRPEWPEDSVAAIDWVAHEDFSLRRMDIGIAENHDIALLFLEEAVLDTPFAYVPTEDEGDQIAEGTDVTVVGWGQQVASESPWDAPEEGTYAIKYMGDSVVGEVGEFEFQVGPEEDDTRKCHGDSGGPTFIRIETEATETLRVIGVTSHAYDMTDCDSKGGVDTRVMALRDWIEAEMIERCEAGTRAWCETPGLPQPPVPVVEEDPEGEGGELDGEEEETKLGCGCATGSGQATAAWGLGLIALAAARRRRG